MSIPHRVLTRPSRRRKSIKSKNLVKPSHIRILSLTYRAIPKFMKSLNAARNKEISAFKIKRSGPKPIRSLKKLITRTRGARARGFFRKQPRYRSILQLKRLPALHKVRAWRRCSVEVPNIRRYRDKQRATHFICHKLLTRKLKRKKKSRKTHNRLTTLKKGRLKQAAAIFISRLSVKSINIPSPVGGWEALILKAEELACKASPEYTDIYSKEWASLRRDKTPLLVKQGSIKTAPAKNRAYFANFNVWIDPAIWRKMTGAARAAHLLKKKAYETWRRTSLTTPRYHQK